MSIVVNGNHPLAEIIAKKLSGIGMVSGIEAMKMISRACFVAVKYHEDELKKVTSEKV